MNVIVTNGTLSSDERDHYIKCITQRYPYADIDSIHLDLSDNKIAYKVIVRRSILTKMGGALISDPNTWNTAKLAEYCEMIPNSIDTLR